jgi:DNA primase
MLGCIIEYPEIVDDPLVEEGIGVLEGDVAWAVALTHNVRNQEPDAWEESFLAHLPAAIHDFAAQRLTRPLLGNAKEARSVFLDNAGKLKRLLLSREHARVVRDIDQAGAHGDERQESALLLEAVRKQRERLGL